MFLRTLFALTAAMCFMAQIATAQTTTMPMNPGAAPPAAAQPQPKPGAKKCQKPNGGCKKKNKKKKNKNANPAAPNGAAPNGAAPNGAAPNGAAPNGAPPNGAAPNGAAPQPMKTP